MCSFTVCNGRAISTRTTLIYTIVHFLLILPMSSALMYFRYKQVFSTTNHSIAGTVDCIQLSTTIVAHWIFLAQSVRRRHDHARFLNELAAANEIFGKTFQVPIEAAPFFRRQLWFSVTNAALFLSIMVVGDYYLEWPSLSGEQNFVPVPDVYFTSYIMFLAMFFQMKHVQCCGSLLLARINLCLATLSSLPQSNIDLTDCGKRYLNVVDALDVVWKLRLDYEKLFGFVVLLSMLLDLTLFVVITFMSIHFVRADMHRIWKSVLLMVISYGIIPFIKNCMVITTIDGFGQSVS